MADALFMDRMFQRIMRGLVDTGRAPHYAEVARALGLGVEEGRLLLHDVMRAYPIGWLHPETDYIASFPPLNNLPTQYRITVRGARSGSPSAGSRRPRSPGSFPARPSASTPRASTAAIR
jgi:hypothetical protein